MNFAHREWSSPSALKLRSFDAETALSPHAFHTVCKFATPGKMEKIVIVIATTLCHPTTGRNFTEPRESAILPFLREVGFQVEFGGVISPFCHWRFYRQRP